MAILSMHPPSWCPSLGHKYGGYKMAQEVEYILPSIIVIFFIDIRSQLLSRLRISVPAPSQTPLRALSS